MDFAINLTRAERIDALHDKALDSIRRMIEEDTDKRFECVPDHLSRPAQVKYKCPHCSRQFDSGRLSIHLAEYFLAATLIREGG